MDLLSAIVLIVYILWSYFAERYPNSHCLHETGIAVLVGLIFGGILKVFGIVVPFSYNVFSFVLLPVVVFSAGVNLRRRGFFKHIAFISLFGIMGTIGIFFILYIAIR